MSSTIKTIMSVVRDVVVTTDKLASNRSLSSLKNPTVVEPYIMISKDVTRTDYAVDVVGVCADIFIAYYMQAADVLTGRGVHDVAVKKVLRNIGTSYGKEEHVDLIEQMAKYKLPGKVEQRAALESANSSKNELLTHSSELSVGKLVDLKLTLPAAGGDDGSEAVEITVPVMFRFLTNEVSKDVLRNISIRTGEDRSLSARWLGVMSGRLRFFRDFIMAEDIIKADRAMALDKDNELMTTLDKRHRREVNRRLLEAGLEAGRKVGETADTSGNMVKAGSDMAKDVPGTYGINSNSVIITVEELRDWESRMGRKITDVKFKDTILRNSYAMTLAVVDVDREMVRFYINDKEGFSEMSVRELKKRKEKSADMMDILKMMQLGSAPAF